MLVYPSVLHYTHPSGDGEPPWFTGHDERFAFDPDFDEFGDYTQRAIQTLIILDDSSSTLTPCSTLMTNQHDFRACRILGLTAFNSSSSMCQ